MKRSIFLHEQAIALQAEKGITLEAAVAEVVDSGIPHLAAKHRPQTVREVLEKALAAQPAPAAAPAPAQRPRVESIAPSPKAPPKPAAKIPALAQLQAKASVLRARDPKLTTSAAFVLACEENPALYAEHRGERLGLKKKDTAAYQELKSKASALRSAPATTMSEADAFAAACKANPDLYAAHRKASR